MGNASTGLVHVWYEHFFGKCDHFCFWGTAKNKHLRKEHSIQTLWVLLRSVCKHSNKGRILQTLQKFRVPLILLPVDHMPFWFHLNLRNLVSPQGVWHRCHGDCCQVIWSPNQMWVHLSVVLCYLNVSVMLWSSLCCKWERVSWSIPKLLTLQIIIPYILVYKSNACISRTLFLKPKIQLF